MSPVKTKFLSRQNFPCPFKLYVQKVLFTQYWYGSRLYCQIFRISNARMCLSVQILPYQLYHTKYSGALAILNAIYTSDVTNYIYTNVGECMDLLSLINCNVGFILYSCMSSRYRSTFRNTILNPAFAVLSRLSSKTLSTRS